MEFTTSFVFNVPKAKVWQGLTDPKIVEQYFFGTQQKSDYVVGSPITFTGEWDGHKYEDKGTILAITPGEYLQYNYWSSMGGTEDKPENYGNISYKLSEKDGKTVLDITQDNLKDEAAKEHSEKNWQMLMEELRKLLENPA
jgi:uncharacterized protein YndB with AHSA1/START domain